MTRKAAITVNRPRGEIERLWNSSEYRPLHLAQAGVAFKDAPGGRGTEIRVDLADAHRGGKVGEMVSGLVASVALARVKDELRRFKQHVETGEISRSDGSPEGERAERRLKQRPAQPLEERELEKVGVR